MPAAHTESSAGGTSQGLPPTPDLPLDTLAAWAQQESRYALVFLDPEGQVLGLTPAASQLLGYRPDELVGRSFSQFFTRRDVALELHLQELNVAQRVGHSEDDRWHRRKNGSLVWISGGVTPVRAADGTLLGFVKVMADRTDIRTQIEALEHRIAALGRERRDGFKPMAHEFANLLGTATQSLNALRRAAPGARASLEDSLSAQLAALSRLTRDLQAPRESGGHPALRLDTFALQPVLQQVVDACMARAQAAGLTLELLLPEGVIDLVADRERVHQVVLNLVTNAIKYTPAGGRVWVHASVEGESALVRVQDTGIGADGHLLQQLSALLSTDAPSLPIEFGTAGIGLAVMRDLVALHGGTLEIRSDGNGRGCTFGVRLPLLGPQPGTDLH